MPHRAPGSTGRSGPSYLTGKPITYYRPRGSEDIRHLIDEGFQAFNAARLGEACRIFADKMLLPEHDTTIALTVAGAMTPAGLGGCVVELMERGLIDFVISTGANLYHDLHYALNFTLHRGSPFVNDVELYEEGVIRIYDVLFPATVLLETDAYIRDFLVRSGLDGPVSTADLHYALGLDLIATISRVRAVFGGGRRRACRRAALHVVAGRQLDRDERRLSRADQRQPPDGGPEQGRQRGLRLHPGRHEERLRHPGRRLAEELLSPGPAHAVGGLRHPKGGNDYFIQITTDQVVWGGLSGATPAEAVSWGKVNPGVLPDTVVAYADSTIAFPLFCEYAVGSTHGRRPLKRLVHRREELVEVLKRQAMEAVRSRDAEAEAGQH